MNISSQAESLLYQPLQHHDSFRLLKVKICPSRDAWVGTLVEDRIPSNCCTADAPKYIALSYVWGDPTFDVPSEDSIEISLSLKAALGHILFRITEETELKIWVDQFCINQRDTKEKEQQVKLMWRIFAGAKQVIGWLGPAFEGSDEALDDLIVFAGALDGAPGGQYSQLVRRQFGENPSVDAVLSYIGNIVLLGSDLRARMLRLFTLPWFSRRWIAQEVCLASNLRICCGCRSISGAQLFRAISVIQIIIVQLVSPWLQRPFRNAFALLKTREVVRGAVKGACHMSLAHLAQTLSFLDCKEDQDRINALFGIIRPPICWFTPEYCPATELYVKFALSHMQYHRSFEILHFAGVADPTRHKSGKEDGVVSLSIASPGEDLPSWVLDWRIRHRQLPMIPVDSGTAGQELTSSAFQVPFDPLQRTLTMRGRFLRTSIKPCGIPYLDRFDPEENPRFQLAVDPWCNQMFVNFLPEFDPSWATQYRSAKTFTHWLESLDLTGNDHRGLLLRFARTLIMDGRVKANERPDCTVPREKILEYFLEYAKCHLVADPDAANATFAAIADDYRSIENAAAYGYLAEQICRYRTLFVGDAGLIGLGSPGIRPGDRVCFFSGLKTPFVVHPKGERFELRGECYLDGLMDDAFGELEAVESEIVLE